MANRTDKPTDGDRAMTRSKSSSYDVRKALSFVSCFADVGYSGEQGFHLRRQLLCDAKKVPPRNIAQPS